MEIRVLREADAQAWWDVRLEALTREPFAFGKSVEEHRATPVEMIAERFRNAPACDLHLGAFQGAELTGTATFIRDKGTKDGHKGHIYGVYVTEAHRGKGVGKALIVAILERVRGDETLEQIHLAVGTRQIAARGLYASLGFVSYGVEPRGLKVGHEYVDEDHMLLRLR